MSFWDRFKASKTAYHDYINSRRNAKLSIASIEETMRGVENWKREFESLSFDASQERNHPVAQKQLNEILSKVRGKHNQLIDLRSRQKEKRDQISQKISRTEEAIQRLKSSIQYDHQKMGRFVRGKGNAWKALQEKINGKEEKLRHMQTSLAELNVKYLSM